jgi:hypothetical protein
MGKYSAVIDTLPRFPGTEPSYMEKVNGERAKIVELNPVESRDGAWLATQWTRLRAQKDEIEEVLSKINVSLEAHMGLIVDAYENAGVTSMRIVNGPSVSMQLEPYAQVVDRDANREWAMRNGLERSLALPWQTLNALSKDRLLQGEEPPPGVKMWSKPKLVMRK